MQAIRLILVVLAQSSLLCAAYLAVMSNQLVTFFGIFMLAGAVLANMEGPTGVLMLLAALLGALLALCLSKFFRRFRDLEYAVLGICLAEIARFWFGASRYSRGALGLQLNAAGTALEPTSQAALVIGVATVSVLFVALFERSVWRQQLRLAVRDEIAARAVGIDVDRLRMILLAAVGVLSSLGGFVYLRSYTLFEPRLLGFEFGVSILALGLVSAQRRPAIGLSTGLAVIVGGELLRGAQEWRGLLFGGAICLVMLWQVRKRLTPRRRASLVR